MRAVLDTNIFISGIFWGGCPGKILDAAQNSKFQLVTSLECIYELNRVLSEFKDALGTDIIDFWTMFAISTSLIALPQIRFLEIKDDYDDNKFLDAAVAGKAQYIVSGDKHLLNLKNFKGIKIIKSVDFLNIIAADNKKAIKMYEKLKEDIIFAERTEAALKRYEKGEFTSLSIEDFLKQLKKK